MVILVYSLRPTFLIRCQNAIVKEHTVNLRSHDPNIYWNFETYYKKVCLFIFG